MKGGFRQSMAWLHTWSGLLVGWVLFLVFSAGTASYFRDEITFWMKPELHAAQRAMPPQTEVAERATAYLQQHAADSPRWFITPPTDREPGLRVSWMRTPGATGKPPPGVTRRGRFDSAILDAATGRPLVAARETRGGEFLYRLHYDLHYMPPLWARWIVGFCAMFMLVAIVSGVITHKRIFKDFFTFRPRKGQRSWLDAHNAVAVLALPYHLMITYTGLVTLMFMYVPWGVQANYRGDQDGFFAEAFPGSGPRDPKSAGIPAPLAPLAPLVAQAQAHWGGAPVGRITVNNPNDAAATVGMQRQEGRDMSASQPGMQFDGVSGVGAGVSGEQPGAASQTRGVMYGLHIGRFADPWLRGLFFLSGLAGCAMVATGLLLWAVRERDKHAKRLAQGGRVGFGLRLVDGLNIGAIAGVPIAIAAYFWANRLLPVGLAGRPDLEIGGFFIAWGMAALCGLAWPTRRMWQVQLAAAGALFAGVPLLGAATGEVHLVGAISAGLWPVAGFELVCLALGLALLASAWRLGRRPVKRAAMPAQRLPVSPVMKAAGMADAGAAR